MINTRAEINVITQGLTNNYSLVVTSNLHLTLVSYNRERRSFKGLYENIQVKIKSIISYTQIFLVKEADH
jgi:hypothetical protein